jgi:hypothetical protein
MSNQDGKIELPGSFEKGINTDIQDFHSDAASYIKARNASDNSVIGDLGNVKNEPANLFCTNAPYKIIGTIHLENTEWAIFSTDNIDSEIGVFDENDCSYRTVVNDRCLNFNQANLITGASRNTYDCSFRIYWQDKRNPDRTLDIGNVPWIQDCNEIDGCNICTDTDELDCTKILLESIITPPCANLTRGPQGGNVLNGSYYVQLAYSINGVRVTDYFLPSNVLSLFDHSNLNTSLILEVDNLDQNFDEYQVVVVQNIAEKTSARLFGTYSTGQNRITIDFIDPTLPAVKLGDLVITNPIAETSEGIFSVGSYLFRTGISGKFDFNYQPLANQIRAKWQTVEYEHYYYRDGGTNIGHMRDEVYSYFVRWVYTTGDKSRAYHIPGRPPVSYLAPDGQTYQEDDNYGNTTDPNNIEFLQGTTPKVYEIFNTATGTTLPVPIILPDGGIVTAEGEMAYWESEEIYPNDKPEIWGDLCGKPIRHHKFPENTIFNGAYSDITNHYTNDKIRVLAIAFENIQAPVDNNGNIIPNIVGYEILRGSRDGNRTVFYKGLINNMREYEIPDTVALNRQGLYPNYPFNSLLPDAFNSTSEVTFEPVLGNSGPTANPDKYIGYNPNPNYSKKHFTFHSPDTMFLKPFLSMKELKIYGAAYGIAESFYTEVRNHPKHVFVTDLTFWVSLVFGLGTAIAKAVGDRTYTQKAPTWYTYPIHAGTTNTVSAPVNAAAGVTFTGIDAANNLADTINQEITSLLASLSGVNLTETALETANAAGTAASALTLGGGITMGGVEITYSGKRDLPTLVKTVLAFPTFATDVSEGADALIDLIRNVSKKRNFALQYMGYCGYENFAVPYSNNRRRLINDAFYLDSHLQNYKTNFRINNVLRAKTVTFDVSNDVVDLTGNLEDTTMLNILASDLPSVTNAFNRRASSHYVAFKSRLRNQYGQLDNIRMIPAVTCPIDLNITRTSGTIFGGDTYIGRFQEKNTFYHFYRWLYDLPDFAEWNYHLYDAVQHTAFWMDTEPFDVMEFVNSVVPALQQAVQNGSVQQFFTNLVTPSDKHSFDRLSGQTFDPNENPGQGVFTVRNAYIYLFHSSVRDFFVETELNIDHRDYLDNNAGKHWDALQNLQEMFDPSIIDAGNIYSLDRSMSIGELPYTKISWAKIQDRDYNPLKAETCYTDFPLRLLYSLPQEEQSKQDNWSVFLANNYKDFRSKVVAIKAIQKTGILILFENHSPGIYPGVDELQLKSGTSITVGDGGLFARQMQRLSNTDEEYEYGSCQNRRAVANTPVGIYYISQKQGKIFTLSDGLREITMSNNEYWFNQYLPYQLLEDFPDFDLIDNPVIGIGCQVIYDNEYRTVYFCKKDYRLRERYRDGSVVYIGNGIFRYNGFLNVALDNEEFFENASWTVSYDPMEDKDVSYHDWHPDLAMGAKNTFLTVKDNGIWKHNNRCDLYCNYYGVDYPFEVEFKTDTGTTVTTLRTIEYMLEVYQYDDNCRDRFHVLDFNFDEAVVFNSEQVSGLLRLNLSPKNDPITLASYPIVGFNEIDILYSKEEHKYRFNQFWDITRDRGEFTPTLFTTIWNTQSNGYIKTLNPVNLNYTKNALELKKFRHYDNRVILRRNICGANNMHLQIATKKFQRSYR